MNFQRYDDVRLVGVPISSNSTGMVHSEQMLALDGAIRLGKSTAQGSMQIENRSKLELHSVCVVRKPTAAEVKKSAARARGALDRRPAAGPIGAGDRSHVRSAGEKAALCRRADRREAGRIDASG